MADEKSDLERGFESLGRALGGVAGRLLGPKAIGKESLPPEPAISREADAAIARAGEDLGRLLNAAGKGLQAHPLDPAGAVREARAHVSDPLQPEEGWAPLTAGISSLGDGLFKVAEGVLDVVAPRKQSGGEAPDAAEADGPAKPASSDDADGSGRA